MKKLFKRYINETDGNGGVGFFGLLAIIFITLKLTGHITWSWFWVLSPLWGSFAVCIVLLVIILMW